MAFGFKIPKPIFWKYCIEYKFYIIKKFCNIILHYENTVWNINFIFQKVFFKIYFLEGKFYILENVFRKCILLENYKKYFPK